MKTAFLTAGNRDKWFLPFLFAALSCPALAHHPMGGNAPVTLLQGLLSGLAHPVIELDHLLFLIGIATATAIARIAPKRAMALLLAYGVSGALGTVMRVSDMTLPFAEPAVAISLLMIGLWFWITNLPGFIVTGLWVSGGFFHGFAYGEAVVGSGVTHLIAYLCGLAFIQTLLMAGAYFIVGSAVTEAHKNLRPMACAISGVISSIALWMLWAKI